MMNNRPQLFSMPRSEPRPRQDADGTCSVPTGVPTRSVGTRTDRFGGYRPSGLVPWSDAALIRGACCIAASVLLFLPLALGLHSAFTVTAAQRQVLGNAFVEPELCRPEPGERLVYLIGIVFLPCVLFALAFVWRRWQDRFPVLPGLGWSVRIALAVVPAVIAWLALVSVDFVYLHWNPFYLYPLLAVPLLPAALLALWWDVGCLRLPRLLLALFLDELLTRLRERPAQATAWIVTTGLAWFLVGSACALPSEVGSIGDTAAARERAASDPAVPARLAEETALLRQAVPAGGEAFLAYQDAAFLQLQSGCKGCAKTTLFQMVRMDEFRELDDLLAKTPTAPVLVKKGFIDSVAWPRKNHGLRLLARTLRANYELVGMAGDGYLYSRRADGGSPLAPDDDALHWLVVRDGALGDGRQFAPYSPRPPWSVEAVLKPAAVQVPYATLVSTHPGDGLGGFVVHQEGPDAWALVIGDGKAWHRVLGFHLQADEWHYLALVHTEETITAYVDGEPAASAPAAGLEIAPSSLPLQVGNWIRNDRPFAGQIKDFRISNRAVPAEEIAGSAGRLRNKLR